MVPDDGGEDVFVHQNNIIMDGFRYLKPGEQVTYELEVGEKGLKAVQVELTSERAPDDSPFGREDDRGGRYDRPGSDRGPRYDRSDRRAGARRGGGDERLTAEVDKLRRKQERLISLLVAKGVLAPGEIDGLEGTQAVVDGVLGDADYDEEG